MSLSDIIKSFFSVRGKETFRYRDRKTGRFVIAPRRFRVTVGLNGLVKHHVYRNFTETRIVFESEIESATSELRELVISKGERFLGYSVNEWWCGEIGEEVQEVSG